MRRGLVLILTFVLVMGLVSGGLAAPDDARDDGVIPGRYIVALDRGDPGEVAAEHRRDHGAEVRRVYRHALRGYAAAMSDEARRADPR
jgi:hypothetical protein